MVTEANFENCFNDLIQGFRNAVYCDNAVFCQANPRFSPDFSCKARKPSLTSFYLCHGSTHSFNSQLIQITKIFFFLKALLIQVVPFLNAEELKNSLVPPVDKQVQKYLNSRESR